MIRGLVTENISIAIAVAAFNDGAVALAKIFKKVELDVG